MQIAVLDLGSTTFHLQHVRFPAAAGGGQALDEKRSIALGEQVFSRGFLDRRSFRESLDAVAELLEMSRAAAPDLSAVVATSAIRSASNGPELVREIERRQRLDVRVLSSDDEARLSYLGQSTSPIVAGRRVAAIDLGGGSVELAVGEGARCLLTCSLPFGALRGSIGERECFGARQASELSSRLREQARDALTSVRELHPEIIVFGSGSARSARRLLMRASRAPGKTGPIDFADFRSAQQALLGTTTSRLVALGVDPVRAGSVLAAATIMIALLDGLGVPSAFVSDKGLRDGVALERYQQHMAESFFVHGQIPSPPSAAAQPRE